MYTRRSRKNSQRRWISFGLLKCVNEKMRSWLRSKKHSSIHTLNEYNQYKIILNKVLRKAKESYYCKNLLIVIIMGKKFGI
jgi:hypothetical protein